MNVIKCTCCKKDKTEDNFAVYCGRRNKQCIECRNYHNTRWALNPDGYKDKRKAYYRQTKDKHQLRNFRNRIFTKYGLSVEDYNKMLNDHSNQCAICKLTFTLDRTKSNINSLPCIDHCHRTNKVRGLLCRKCNVFLGLVESGFIDKANEYLRVYEMRDKELA